jgi:hypothetical protein
MDMKSKLAGRLCLDRRRLEEAFLLYAILKTHFKYDLGLILIMIEMTYCAM